MPHIITRKAVSVEQNWINAIKPKRFIFTLCYYQVEIEIFRQYFVFRDWSVFNARSGRMIAVFWRNLGRETSKSRDLVI